MIAPPVRTFGKYLLDEEIARGGMSRVYLARLRGLGGFEKRLVVKQILPELASDPRFISMFVQEAKTLVQMSHPHIAPVYELGVVDGVYFLAMEYVDGGTLSQILENGPLAPPLAAHMGAQICEALHYAHERFDIIHRDVTPRNVIVDTEGHACLIDFGIAAPASDRDGDLFGTPGYLSPEQARGEPLGPPSDVFALGAVLYEALTARQAFFARNVEEAREVLTMEGPDFYPDDLVPEALAKIVHRALAREREDRFGSARELGRALRSWVAKHAPEGVGPELAERARQAESKALTTPNDELDDATSSDGEVETLATSRLLDAMLAPPVAVPTLPANDEDRDEPGTARIERETDEPGTTRIEREGQGERAEPEDDDGEVHRAVVRPREVSRPLDSSSRLVLGALAILIVGSVAWAAWPPAETAENPGPNVDAPPDERPPPPVEDPGGEDPDGEAHADETVTDAAVEIEPPVEAPARAPAAHAFLTANASPWANITLDGRDRGNRGLRAFPIRPGRHVLVFSNPSLRDATANIVAEPGQTLRVVVDLNANPPTISISRSP